LEYRLSFVVECGALRFVLAIVWAERIEKRETRARIALAAMEADGLELSTLERIAVNPD